MGYSTPEHQQALAALGACRHHRTSFAPVRERLAQGVLVLEMPASEAVE
jgi:ribonuclease HII